MISKAILILFLLCTFGATLKAIDPIVPSQVLTPKEIDDIRDNRNFFYYQDLDLSTPIWKGTNRKYSNHYLKSRTSFFTLDDVIHRTLTDGFPIQYHTQQLYRAKMGVHSRVGNILPKLSFAFGNGMILTPIDQIFVGALGFLWPTNWMKLANQIRVYKATKSILLKSVLDQILAAKLIYLQQHQTLQEFEILNYYFIHLQLFCDKPFFTLDRTQDRLLSTLIGLYASLGNRMAGLRSKASLGFDDLAHFIALESSQGDYTTSAINIADIDHFPERVKDLDEVEDCYRDKKTFLEKAVKQSIEMKIITEFLKVSKLDIGITAFGSMFLPLDGPVSAFTDAGFAFQFGYNTLPNILIAKSFANTATIDVRSEYIKMLDSARRSFDLYTNALEAFSEAKRALSLNRLAFKQNIQYFVDSGSLPDGLFVASLLNVIEAELSFNNALHSSLVARAFMDRFLLKDDNNAVRYLPHNDQIIKIYNEFVQIYAKDEEANDRIDSLLRKVRTASGLKKLLYDDHTLRKKDSESGELVPDDLLVKAVKRNIGSLLFSKLIFYKSKSFYKILYDFISQNNIELTHSEESLLRKKLQKKAPQKMQQT